MNKRKMRFKREYIPVIIAFIILILLISALVFVILYKEPEKVSEPKQDYQQEEIIIDNANSKCSTKELEELYKIAKKVELDSKKTEISLGTSFIVDDPNDTEVEKFGTVFEVTLKNMTDDLYIVVTNDYDEETITLKKDNMVDGAYKFKTKYTQDLITYTIELRSNKYKCVNEAIRKFTFITPIFNIFSDMYTCLDYPEYKFCQEFITEDVPTYQEFFDGLYAYQKENNITTSATKPADKDEDGKVVITTTKKKEEVNNSKNNKVIDKNIVYIISAVIILGVVAIVTTILIIKRRSKKL